MSPTQHGRVYQSARRRTEKYLRVAAWTAAAKFGGSPNIPRPFFGNLRPTSNFFLGATPPTHHSNTASMPKSKRAKIVHLSKTDKKGKELSQRLFANVQEAADNFEHIFVFSVENMRNSYLKAVRAEFADSRYVHRATPRKDSTSD
jgi:hypothetical protein